MGGDVAQVVAVDADRAGGRVVEAGDELRQRRLAGAGRADERDGLARRDRERHVVERGRRVAVGEGHAVEDDLAAQPREVGRAGRVDQLGLLVEQLEDLVQRGHARLVGRVELGELLDRVEEVVQRGQEGDEDADRDLALDRLDAAVEQDAGGRDRGQQLDAGEVRGVEVDRLHVRDAVLLVERLELLEVARLLRERAHDPDAGQRLLQVGGDRRDLLARGAVGVGADDPEGERRDAQDREDDVGDQRELGVEREQDHRGADQRQRRAEERDDAVADERVERLDVVGEPRDQHARPPARVEADRHRLQVREELDAQVLQRALADPAGHVGLHVGRAPVDERGAHERDDDPRERGEVARRDALVDRQLGQRRRRERGGRGEQQRRRTSAPRARGTAAAAPRARAACARARTSPASAGRGRRGGRAPPRRWRSRAGAPPESRAEASSRAAASRAAAAPRSRAASLRLSRRPLTAPPLFRSGRG